MMIIWQFLKQNQMCKIHQGKVKEGDLFRFHFLTIQRKPKLKKKKITNKKIKRF